MDTGLDGIIVADTSLSSTDALTGELWYRGVVLSKLVGSGDFESVIALLWDGLQRDMNSVAHLKETLGARRVHAYQQSDPALLSFMCTSPELATRIGLAALPDNCSPTEIVAHLSVSVAARIRLRAGGDIVQPDQSLSLSEDFLRMAHGRLPSAVEVQALNTYWICMCENGVGPSSFAARVIASTRASPAAAVLGAFCAFQGPLHGGAPGAALDLLDALSHADNIEAFVETHLRSGKRLMGFGHRSFPGKDSRSCCLEEAIRALDGKNERLALAEEVVWRVQSTAERLKPGRRLAPNVEIPASILLEALGIPRDIFTEVFAIGRSVGWIAHALEQQQAGRMIRPTARYVDKAPKGASPD